MHPYNASIREGTPNNFLRPRRPWLAGRRVLGRVQVQDVDDSRRYTGDIQSKQYDGAIEALRGPTIL